MAVTKAEFDAMPQVAYAKARDDLRTGDILLFHSSGLGSDLIEYFTDSLWCHAAFIWRLEAIDRVLLLESVDKFGVRAAPMSTRINGSAAAPKPYPGKLLVLRHDEFPPPPNAGKVAVMTQFALDRLGYPYSTAELAEISARIAAGLAGLTLPGRLDPKTRFICSEYVAKCFEAMGVVLAPDREGFIAPADIANDPKARGVYSLRPDLAEPETALVRRRDWWRTKP
jgi:hypothetical protein